jgi:hypothetical protein
MAVVAAAAFSLILAGGMQAADAKNGVGGGGGTAKPPRNVPPPILPTFPAVPPPVFTAGVADIHGFDVTGFIQATTLDNGTMCPGVDAGHRGGTVKVNGITINVPCNSIVQLPANTLTWADVLDPTLPSLALGGGSGPSYEAHVVGNIVGGKHIAGLVYLSQQGVNSGQGVVTRIDYSTGTLIVGGAAGGTGQVSVRINDPKGRFGRAQSPDPRFSVDDENPTIHAGTGYPMCVPRTDPTKPGGDDPLCPQKNRPKVNQQLIDKGCRTFTEAGVVPLPNGGELSAPAAGQTYCGHFVMEDPATVVGTTRPDANQQAPFEAGDHIDYSGTLLRDTAGTAYISAHTIEANVGVFTQPNTQPSYLAIGDFGVGSADPQATAINGAPQETQDRIFLEASTTDVKSVVDIYLIDVDPKTGKETQRWVTPFEMTGEQNGPAVTSTGLALGGGITTQFTGPQSQRARLRATKAPTGLLNSPTRNLRVAVRSLCVPSAVNADVTPGVPCLQSKPAANGLFAGQYKAPVFEYIFPENTQTGDPVVPANLWQLGFLVNGEGTNPGAGGPGQLKPTPW